MAKLCRFYVSGAGNESARFNPLIIDLRDRHEWKPQNTIVWLRNGGGKTTLISLFYTIFVPKLSDFLGMRNGKGAKLNDFVREDELAIVATEWQPSDATAPRRTVGTVILKTARELKRFFFSFNETKTTSFSFDTLPARGLSEAAGSYDAFRERLNEAMREHPSIELVLTEIQGSWIQHLDSIGLDTELFRTHLIMNSQEGGAADIFKIKNPEDFVKKFLELAYDEGSTEEIEKNLQAFKEKRESAPHYAKSIDFGETLVRLLTPFALDVAKRSVARNQQAALNGEAAKARYSVQARRDSLNQEIADLNDEISNYSGKISEQTLEHRRLNTSARGYKTLGRRIRVDETKAAFEAAAATEKAASQELAVLKAAKEFAAVRSVEREHTALVQERDKLHEDLRPQLKDLQRLGGRLKAAWTKRVADLAAAHEHTRERVQKAKANIIELTNEQASLSARITGAERDRDSAQKAIRAYEEAHRRLRASDAILANEKASEASSRLKSEAWTIGNSIETLKVGLGLLNSRLRSMRDTLVNLNKSSADAEAVADKTEGRLIDEEEHRIQIERLPIIEEVVIGGEVQLKNPFLLNRLDEIAEDAQSKLIQIGVLGADDLRDDVSLDKFGLLAPSADVEALVSQLVANGIKTAIPAYHWLAEHCSAEKAASLCQLNPAVCSGILIQNPKDFERARLEVKKAEIRGPIVLFCSTPSQDGPLPSDLAVVSPQEAGMYSKQEAALSQPAIAGRRDERATMQGELESRRTSAQTAATRIKTHLGTYPAERLKGWEDELAEARKQVSEFGREIETATAEIAETETQISEKARQNTEHLERKGVVARQESEVSTFIRDHEQNIGIHRVQFAELTTQSNNLSRDLEENRIRTSELRDALGEFEGLARDQDFKWREACKMEADIPSEFIGEEPPSNAESGRPEDIAPEFLVAVANYRGLLTASGLDGRIAGKSEELKKARDSFTQVSKNTKDVRPERIERASLAADIDSEIEEQGTIYRAAGQTMAVAKSNYDIAAKDNPADSDFKSGSLIDEKRETQPTTSTGCLEVAAEYESLAVALAAEIENAKGNEGHRREEPFEEIE